MFSSFTPAFFIAPTAPCTSGPIHSAFQRAWTIPMRSCEAVGKEAGGAEGPLKAKPDELAAVGGDMLVVGIDSSGASRVVVSALGGV